MARDPGERTWTRVAAILGVTEQSVRNWIGKPTVPVLRARQLLAVLVGDESIADVGAWLSDVGVDRDMRAATAEEIARVRDEARRLSAQVAS